MPHLYWFVINQSSIGDLKFYLGYKMYLKWFKIKKCHTLYLVLTISLDFLNIERDAKESNDKF